MEYKTKKIGFDYEHVVVPFTNLWLTAGTSDTSKPSLGIKNKKGSKKVKRTSE